MTPDAGGVLAATALLTVVIGLAIGVVSAWQSVAVRVDEGLRGRGTTGSLGRFGRGLLVAQVALSMTLLVGAGLFTATLAHLRANDTSLQSQRIVFTRAFREPGDRELLPPDYYRTLVSGLAHMPGADAAALSVYYPTYFGLTGPLPTDYHYTRADGVTPLDGTVLTEFVSPGFFDLFRFQRLQGRDVSWDDGLEKPAVALVSASLARALFPAGDAVGRQIRIAGPQRRDVEMIGVVADAPYVKLDDPRPLVVFRPIHAGSREGAVSDGICPGERRPRDGARGIYARREVAGASFSARFHDVIRMGQPCAVAGSVSRQGWPHLPRRSRSCWPAWACTGCSRTP